MSTISLPPPPHKIVDLLLSHNLFLIAVASAFHSFEALKRHPRSEWKWITSKRGRRILREYVVSEWARLTGMDADDFPFNIATVQRAFISVGKDGERKLLAWAQGQQPSLFV